MSRYTPAIGEVFGRLTVISGKVRTEHSGAIVTVRCICGTVKTVRAYDLKSGGTKSCGCQRCRQDGLCTTAIAEYRSWRSARTRCYDLTDASYCSYGARGIRMCDRWKNSFAAFLADMGTKPTPGHTLERIDVNGDYCPENCKWIPRAEQAHNRTDTRYIGTQPAILYYNENKTRAKVPYHRFMLRVFYHGWHPETALTAPIPVKV